MASVQQSTPGKPVEFRFSVEIAAGSDSNLAKSALLEIAFLHHDVLLNPPPAVTVRSHPAYVELELSLWRKTNSRTRRLFVGEVYFMMFRALRNVGIVASPGPGFADSRV